MAKVKENDKRQSLTVWLKPRQVEMLKQMPDVSVGGIARKAIEELFEGRNDRDFAHVCVEGDVEDMTAEWERILGMTSSATVTDTQDGFRVVIIALKKFSDA
jgi:hypothetical protein